MFQYPHHEEIRLRSLERARQAFGWAYNYYGETGYEFRMARLGIVAAALPIYERWAAKEAITDEQRETYLADLARSSEQLLPRYKVSKDQTLEARMESILLLGRLGHRGDTRHPITEIAVPATLRQRVGHLGRGIEAKHGRYNWSISMLRRQKDDAAWRIDAGLKIATEYESQELYKLHPDVLLVAPKHLLGKDVTSQDVRQTLDILTKHHLPTKEGGQKAPRNSINGLAKTITRLIANHNVTDFATGKDFAD